MREARLDQVLETLPAGLPLPQACWVMVRVAKAIAAQPRSLAPEQIRIRGDGGVRVAPQVGATPFGYQAPEELTGKGANVRSAVFSLGTVLVEAITGRAAFSRESDFETRIAVKQDVVAPLVGRVAQATPELDALLARALAKDPADRFGSTVELAEELERFLEESLLEVGAADVQRTVRPLIASLPAVDPRREEEPAEPAPAPPPRPPAKRKPALPEPSAHDFANASLDLQPEQRRVSAPHKPRFDQELVRVADGVDGDAGAGVTEASVTGVRPSGPSRPRAPSARDLLEIDERALSNERTKGGTLAPTTDPPPPSVNWTLRIAMGLLALVALAAAYQLLLRPLLLG